jgi:hypothetical protein
MIAKWLAFATTIYLLIIYLISVRADWAISKVKRWSPLASVADTKAAMKADEKARSEADSKRKEEIESLRTVKNKIRSEMRTQLDEITSQIEEVWADLKSMPGIESATPQELELRDSLYRKKTELLHKQFITWQEMENRIDPFIEAMDDLANEFSLKPTISMREERADIEPKLLLFNRLTRLRIVVEIVFPAAYAVFALAWTFYESLQNVAG